MKVHVRISIRVRKADVDLIDRAARKLGITRSALIRHASEAHALRIIAMPDDPHRPTIHIDSD